MSGQHFLNHTEYTMTVKPSGYNQLLRTTVGVSFPWGFSVVVGCGVATKRRGVDFVVKKGVGGFAEGGRNGEERVRR